MLRRRLTLSLPRKHWVPILYAATAATIVLVLLRIAIYGNLGGYPDVARGGGNVNFVIHPKTFSSVATRLPAALLLINSGAGLPVWLRITLVGYTGFLSFLLFGGANTGKRIVLLLLPFLAVVPMLNMFGWMTQFAQQGRYLYHPVIWIVFVLVCALRSVRFSTLLFPAWIAIMAAAALFNTLAYVKMIRTVHLAVSDAAKACNNAGCCHTLVLRDVPRDLYGAFYFHYQVVHDLEMSLLGVAIVAADPAAASAQCAVNLRWTEQNTWSEAIPAK